MNDPTIVELIIAQISSVTTMMINILTALLANIYFQFLFACGFLKIGMSLIRKAKKTSKQLALLGVSIVMLSPSFFMEVA